MKFEKKKELISISDCFYLKLLILLFCVDLVSDMANFSFSPQQVSENLTGVTRTRGNLNVASRVAGETSPSPNNHWATRTDWRV